MLGSKDHKLDIGRGIVSKFNQQKKQSLNLSPNTNRGGYLGGVLD